MLIQGLLKGNPHSLESKDLVREKLIKGVREANWQDVSPSVPSSESLFFANKAGRDMEQDLPDTMARAQETDSRFATLERQMEGKFCILGQELPRLIKIQSFVKVDSKIRPFATVSLRSSAVTVVPNHLVKPTVR